MLTPEQLHDLAKFLEDSETDEDVSIPQTIDTLEDFLKWIMGD